MENTIFIALFAGGFLIFLLSMGVDMFKLLFHFVARCLLGIIIISVANFILEKSGVDFIVNINEISVGVSGILGIWGIVFLYVLQYYFTIT